jgi:type VI secretion system protein ImpA
MIDAEKLLAPIAADAPAGRDLRAAADDRTHHTLREQRTGGEAGDPRNANWAAIRRQCEDALATQSKDLELAGWLAEALARTEGLPGLLEGLAFIRELTTRFWEDVHPQGQPDGERTDYTARIARLNWLASERGGLLPSVRAIGLVGDAAKPSERLGWDAYLTAERVRAASVSNEAGYQEMVASGQTTPEQWAAAVASTPRERIREDAAAARACEQEVRALEALTEERAPDGAASLHGLAGLLSDIAEYLEARLPAQAAAAESSGPASGSASRAGAGAATGPLGSRADALARLSEVARYFRETEPHSPVSRLIERAVRWGNMSFEEVLRDVVKNESALSEIWDTLGVKPPESNS